MKKLKVVLTFKFSDGSHGFSSYLFGENESELMRDIDYHEANYNVKEFKVQVLTVQEAEELFQKLIRKIKTESSEVVEGGLDA